MEAGNALEPVVVRAMERAGWKVDAADPQYPQQVAVRIGPNLLVTGHPDGTVRLPVEGDEAAAPQLFLFEGEPQGPAYGDPMVVEIKTRGPEAFKRWQTLGAERSHPASVAQAAFYSLGEFGDLRDAVIATMDTGARTWDWERIPAARLERALRDACEWLGEFAAHHVRSGPDPDALPDRDFSETSWQCRSCPFLAVCLPGAAETSEETEIEDKEVSDEEARDAVAAYAEAQESIKEPEKAKRAALDTLKGWMRRQGDSKATVGGRTVTLVSSTRYSVNHRRLNEALDPGGPGRDRHGERVGVRAGEHLDASPVGSAGRGRLPSIGESAPLSFKTGAARPRYFKPKENHMSRTINKVELLGRVGTDPEMQCAPRNAA